MNDKRYWVISKLWRIILIVPLLYTTVSCEQQTANTSESKEIEQLLQSYYATMSDRDWQAYQEFFSNDATLTTIWAQDSGEQASIHSSTISEFVAQTANGPDSQPIFEERMLSSEVTVRNDLAQAWVQYGAKFGSESNLMEWTGTDLFSFIRFENQWKIVSITFTQD